MHKNKLLKLYQSNIFNKCKNRFGIRKTTADILEDKYCELVTQLNIPLTIEIGAHEGSFSVNIKKQKPTTECHAYEANPFVFKKYQTKLNDLGIKYHNLAISNINNEIILNIPISRNNSSLRQINPISSIFKREEDSFKYKEITVTSKTIEKLYLKDNRQKSLWIDVEGAQMEVLSPIKNVWSTISTVYIEIEKSKVWMNEYEKHEIHSLLANKGFIEIMRDNIADLQYNAVYVHKSLVEDPIVLTISDDYFKKILSSTNQ